jgi:hypothetical protein
MTGLVAAIIVALGAGIGSATPVHASNIGSIDCNGLWVDPAANTYFFTGVPFTDSDASFHGGGGGTTATENGVSTYNNVFYTCDNLGNGQYYLSVIVWHDDLYTCGGGTCSGNADSFVSYDCAELWHNGSWGNPQLHCEGQSQGSLAGHQGSCPASCTLIQYSATQWETTVSANFGGFASEDRSGLSPSLVQPTGYAQETPPVVQNWADQP